MKAMNFNFKNDLNFDLQSGITSFKDSRLVIFDANAIGLLRQSIIKELGIEKAKHFFMNFGFRNGYSDFLQMKYAYKFDSDMDLLASGPMIHTWEGIVQATPTEIKINREKKEMYFTGIWKNSYEAQQHLTFNEHSHEPVCWSLVGYATGWSTAFLGTLTIAKEPHCMAKGDEHCGWKIQTAEVWGDEAREERKIYEQILSGGNHG